MSRMSITNITSKRVCVLAGGWSDEREVSLMSGKEVAKALKEAGFKTVDLIDIQDMGFVNVLVKGGYDVAFVAMHGRFGEDGCIQGLLEVMHIPYTFSGVLASSVAMEKDITKHVYRRANIPVAKDVVLEDPKNVTETELDEIVEALGLPLFVKPVANGSSFGVTLVKSRDELSAAIERASQEDGHVLIEESITGDEITVPVIGNKPARALLPIEVVTGADFYDERVKYEPTELHHVIPARLDQDVLDRACEYAVRAHEAIGCKGCSRSDFIVTADGTPVILETNTIPGMTSASLLPDSARHAGISFPELCTKFVELALEDAEGRIRG